VPPELRHLMERFVQLGWLLPQDPDLLDLPEDAAGLAGVRMVMAEMFKTRAEIDAFLELARRESKTVGR